VEWCLWVLVAIYAAARVTQAFPDSIPTTAIVALHVLPPLAFAIVHGAAVYRRRGILIFVVLCLAIGGGAEELSLYKGFPFGHYHFTDAMGPKILQVPILLGLAYVGVGYLAWTLANIILPGARIWTRPLLAAAIMTAWDLAMDPIWANLVHLWVWHEGGTYYGVPISNFLGWLLTNYLIYQAFTWVAANKPLLRSAQAARFWAMPILFYGIAAVGNLFVTAPAGVETITDASGTAWSVGSMLNASRMVSIAIMGAFTVLAWWRLRRRFGANSGSEASHDGYCGRSRSPGRSASSGR
jgi:uncharacterized membrane protein